VQVDGSKVSPKSRFKEDLSLDSLDVVEVVMAIEEEFALEIPDAEVRTGTHTRACMHTHLHPCRYTHATSCIALWLFEHDDECGLLTVLGCAAAVGVTSCVIGGAVSWFRIPAMSMPHLIFF
jgi:Phosphopantetheine attachment site